MQIIKEAIHFLASAFGKLIGVKEHMWILTCLVPGILNIVYECMVMWYGANFTGTGCKSQVSNLLAESAEKVNFFIILVCMFVKGWR